jgi:16S rRNA (guanine527-N7)-methyltransferase
MAGFDVSQVLGFDVSRETEERLLRFSDLIKKWNPAINLVSKSSVADIWDRHIVDSAQIFPMLPVEAKQCLDIGSGAGLPGLVLAILSHELSADRHFSLVESDQRKCVFLREVARAIGLYVTVISDRIEKLPPHSADVISARALAPLSKLVAHAAYHLRPDGVCFFPKGEMYLQELDVARMAFSFEYEVLNSKTDLKGAILKIYGIENV